MENSINILKESINVGGKTYYHYELGGKYISDEWVVFNGVTYYNNFQ